jgi:integrase
MRARRLVPDPSSVRLGGLWSFAASSASRSGSRSQRYATGSPVTLDGRTVGARNAHPRHYYASLLIRHGESIKVVQARLGHASASETLDTYSHLWPDSEDMTRAAVDGVLGRILADSVRTTGGAR